MNKKNGHKNWPAGLATAGLGAAAGLFTYAHYLERLWVEVTHSSLALDTPHLPPGGLRILHLSDLHFAGHGWVEARKVERTLRLLDGAQYDLLLITGDFIHNDQGLPTAVSFIERLPRPRLGAFACLGNHDFANYSWSGIVRQAWSQTEGDRLQNVARQVRELVETSVNNGRLHLGVEQNDIPALVSALETRGVRVLRNEHARVGYDGGAVWLAGIDDLMEGQPDMDAALNGRPAGALTILLAHHPDLLLEPALQQFDVGFSGHVHGGQVRLPGVGALYTGSHLSAHKTAGWFQFGQMPVHISRGLGESTLVRFGVRPEVSWIDLLRR